ncbi:DUF7541 family protein [Halococcus saccharolyticus]|uniref:Cox cluster protein n=1 Tax=Halococcus saccharolyticus DSM 5350 TaxID=1227455 RepID=M0MID5_9EURY|nr:hypothetical protein [Halococcus saccharolyticus]EMA44205.1 hypothetical protein C449_11783 [Halococcus saccharolyticus DSM 5350]
MDDQPGISDQYRMSSPWPLIVVLGFVCSELGLLFNVFPVAVGGLLLLVGSVAGIVQESGYAERPWNLLVGLGLALVALGGILAFTQLDSLSVDALASTLLNPSGIVTRGVALAVAGLVAALVGAGGRYVESDPY